MARGRTADPERRTTVDAVIVAWNHEAWLDRCVDSVNAQQGPSFTLGRILIVDNASTEPVRNLIRDSSTTSVVTNRANVGFAAACNQAAAASRADLLLFLNPDTRLDRHALERAVAMMQDEANTDVGIVGLHLTDASGASQRSCGPFPGFLEFASQLLGLSALAPGTFPGVRMSAWPHDRSRDVDYVSAAAALVRRPLFAQLGGFDERLFLYLEDIDLALRARRLGWRTRFCADARVEHALGWASGGHRDWRIANAWRSLILYGWKHLRAHAAAALTGLVLLGAPAARLMQAVLHSSPTLAADTLRAWLLLWRFLLFDTPVSRRRSSPIAASLAASEAKQPPPVSSI